MNTGTANSSGAHSEKGPRSLYDSEGRRKTPEPTTALMHIATRPQKPTVRTSFTVGFSFIALGSFPGGMQNAECRMLNGERAPSSFNILHSAFCIPPGNEPREMNEKPTVKLVRTVG